VLLPALTAPEFIGMGRYLLVAFPVYAVAAELLRPACGWPAPPSPARSCCSGSSPPTSCAGHILIA
jgi:hypothetical protein